MTRLTPKQVQYIPINLRNYEKELKEKTGTSLLGIAKHALNIEDDITSLLNKTTVAIIPITAGEGIIPGFTEAVLAILNHIRIDAHITKRTDVEGLAEAIAGHADVLLAADDNAFVAINLRTRYVSDNSICTGRAYVAALDLAVRGLEEKTVLVIGFGPVGHAATTELLNRGAHVVLYDIDKVKLGHAKQKFEDRIHIVHSIKEGTVYADLIIDASPAANIISEDMIKEYTFIAAPGIPLGITSEAQQKLPRTHLIHDTLELGVATMVLDAVFAHNL